MDNHIRDFFSQSENETPSGNFHKVISLHENRQLDWDDVSIMIPKLCKGWYELARLPTRDRMEFVQEYWLTTLPYHPKLQEFLSGFFSGLDDIGIFLYQQKFDDPYQASMVYSLKNNGGFFRGAPPALEKDVLDLKLHFPNVIFPQDYLAFLQIHNGFSKATDSTGITSSDLMWDSYTKFQEMAAGEFEITTTKGKPIDPTKLIPFYESFGMPFFQCFYTEWYPNNEMGNVYYSGVAKTISDINNGNSAFESMGFSTFIDWLMFYLERVD